MIMRRALLPLYCLLFLSTAYAQRITLNHLMRIHSLEDTAIGAQLKQAGWQYLGVQKDVLRKPRMYSLNVPATPEARLYLYSYRKKPLCKVELVCDDVDGFNTIIRDSLAAYGFRPDMDHMAPDEENLKITSSAYFINKDAALPVHALILYFEERQKPKVSLTIYGDE
jgi:hypothetical protein